MTKNQYKKLWLSAAIAMLTALPTQAQKYVGGDMSMLPKYEAANTQYKDLQGKRIILKKDRKTAVIRSGNCILLTIFPIYSAK